MAEIEVFVKDACAMQGRRDPGHLGDDSPLEDGKACPIETSGEARQELIDGRRSRQLGDHQKALQAGPRTDALAGGDDLGDVDAQGAHSLEVSPFGGGGRVPAGRVEECGDSSGPGQVKMPLQVDRQRMIRPDAERPARSIGPAWRESDRGSRGS